MRDRITIVGAPCSALLAAALLHVTHAGAPLAFVAACILPVTVTALERPKVPARLPLSIGLLLLLCSKPLRHNLMAIPGAAALASMLAVLSAMIVILTLVFAMSTRGSPPHWLRMFTMESSFGAAAVRAEIGLAWFALARWRSVPSDIPADAEAFRCTATGTDVAMAWVAAGIGLVEAPILHLALRHYSVPVAWAATGLAVLTSVYFVGFAKSLAWRPTLLFEECLLIRLGVVLSQAVARSEIEEVEILASGRAARDFVRLFAFDGPNVAVRARGRVYSFRVDRPEQLLVKLRFPSPLLH